MACKCWVKGHVLEIVYLLSGRSVSKAAEAFSNDYFTKGDLLPSIMRIAETDPI